MKHVNIIAWDNGAGLSRNVTILSRVLRNAGFNVTVSQIYKVPLYRNQLYRSVRLGYAKSCDLYQKFQGSIYYNVLGCQPPYDVNLFFQEVVPKWFSYARINCLIPNQEWFQEKWHPYLRQFDWILCQSKFAQSIFEKLGCKTQFISFTSLDRFNQQFPKDYNQFFHLAGRSLQKGTNTLIDLWSRHPEWPCLKIIQNRENLRSVSAENIEYITQYLDETTLSQYQNVSGIHLCPSEAEGFGHYIVEAMSCKAVTITTNAPPMNELITLEKGLLADYQATSTQGLGVNYYINSADLERQVDKVLGMDYLSKQHLGENARDWYLQNDQFFKHQIVEFLKEV